MNPITTYFNKSKFEEIIRKTIFKNSKLNNLAGKYRGGYGTPFDLSELPDTALLNKDSVLFVKVIDVVGIIDSAFGSFDSYGNFVNDPFPTPFASGGFDLDAIAVLKGGVTSIESYALQNFRIVPNPARGGEVLHLEGLNQEVPSMAQLCTFDGVSIPLSIDRGKVHLPKVLAAGIYLISIHQEGSYFSEQILIR
jgi:hypothetical protein